MQEGDVKAEGASPIRFDYFLLENDQKHPKVVPTTPIGEDCRNEMTGSINKY